jgi:hypothetical protein
MQRGRSASIPIAVSLGLLLAVAACGGPASSSVPPSLAGSPSAAASVAPSVGASGVPSASPAGTSSPSGPASSPVGRACGALTAAEILQFAGITVTGMNDIGGACAYVSVSGSHSATKDKNYLAGKDGIIIGVIPVPVGSTSGCPTRSVSGAPTTASVCNLPGPEVLAIFKATSGSYVELNVFSSATMSGAQVDGLIVAAFGRL